jgi:hypothetical protein
MNFFCKKKSDFEIFFRFFFVLAYKKNYWSGSKKKKKEDKKTNFFFRQVKNLGKLKKCLADKNFLPLHFRHPHPHLVRFESQIQ